MGTGWLGDALQRRKVLIGAGSVAGMAGAAGAWRLATGSPGTYARYTEQLRAPLPVQPDMQSLVRLATLAANSHNTQPWRFVVGADTVDILPDPARATPAVDPHNHHLFVSLGCALENLVVAATASGRPGTVTVRDDGSVRYRFSRAAPRSDALLGAIVQRQSTRADYDGQAVAARDLLALQRAAEEPGVQATLLTARPQLHRVRDLVVAANDAQLADAAYLAELKTWLRFSPRGAMHSGDGLYAAASGNPAMPEALGRLAFDLFFTASAERAKYARQIDSSAGIAVWTAARQDPAHWVAVGRAVQRFALTATVLGLQHAHINQPVEVPAVRSQLAALLGQPGALPDIVVRFGHGPTLPFSPRRPVASVVTASAGG